MLDRSTLAFAGRMKQNQYPDATSKRLHIKGIDAALRYSDARKPLNRLKTALKPIARILNL